MSAVIRQYVWVLLGPEPDVVGEAMPSEAGCSAIMFHRHPLASPWSRRVPRSVSEIVVDVNPSVGIFVRVHVACIRLASAVETAYHIIHALRKPDSYFRTEKGAPHRISGYVTTFPNHGLTLCWNSTQSRRGDSKFGASKGNRRSRRTVYCRIPTLTSASRVSSRLRAAAPLPRSRREFQ